MADNVKINEGDDVLVSTEEITSLNGSAVTAQQAQRLIAALRTADGTAVDVGTANPMPVTDASNGEVLGEILHALITDGVLTSDAAALTQLEYLVTALEKILLGPLKVGGVGTSGNVRIEGMVQGDLEADAIDSVGNRPVKVGGKARTALVAVSAAGDRTDLSTDKMGRVFAVAAPLDQRTSGTLNRTNTTAANVIGAPGASTAIVVTDILVTNAHATVGTKVSVRDGETAKLTGYAAAAGGGFTLHNPDGLFVATANTAITAVCGTAGADVDITVSGYKIPA